MKPRCLISVVIGYEFEVGLYRALLRVLPDDTKLIRAGMDYYSSFMMRFVFESEQFPLVEPAALTPDVTPVFHTDNEGRIVKVELPLPDGNILEVEGPCLESKFM